MLFSPNRECLPERGNTMRHRFVLLASMALMTGFFQGCGTSNEPLTTAPGIDTRTEQDKEADSLLEKSQKEYNKKIRR